MTMGGGLDIPTDDLDDIMHDSTMVALHPLPPLSGYVDFSWIGVMYDNNFKYVPLTQELEWKLFMAQDLDRV